MAKRTIGVERLFNLGNYKNVRISEFVELDDKDWTEEELDLWRILTVFNAYWTFASHQDIATRVLGEELPAMIEMIEDERGAVIKEIVEAARKLTEEEVKEDVAEVLDVAE